MKLESILDQLKDVGNTGMSKTAPSRKSETASITANKEAAAKTELVRAIDNALNTPDSTKVATEQTSAAAELVKKYDQLLVNHIREDYYIQVLVLYIDNKKHDVVRQLHIFD